VLIDGDRSGRGWLSDSRHSSDCALLAQVSNSNIIREQTSPGVLTVEIGASHGSLEQESDSLDVQSGRAGESLGKESLGKAWGIWAESWAAERRISATQENPAPAFLGRGHGIHFAGVRSQHWGLSEYQIRPSCVQAYLYIRG